MGPPLKNNFKKGDYVDLSIFKVRIKQSASKPHIKDPKSGYYIQDERTLNSGSGPHKGAYKLFNKAGKRIGTLTKEGKFLRK